MEKDDSYWCPICKEYSDIDYINHDLYRIPYAAVEAHPLVAALRADRDRLREVVIGMVGASEPKKLETMRSIIAVQHATFNNPDIDKLANAINALIASLEAGV